MKNPMMKTWRKIKSYGNFTGSSTMASMKKSKSWNGSVSFVDNESKGMIKKESPPQHGFFTVCVGSKKERVLVKTKLVNHPLFKKLLEDAENEYGYIRDGPIVLPCEVDFFLEVLAQMKSNDNGDDDDDDDDDGLINPPICGIGSPYYRSRSSGGSNFMAFKRNSSYKILRSPSSKLNRF